MERNCTQTLSISEQYCILYLGESIPEVSLINGQCYPLSVIIDKLWQWINYLSTGGTTTTSTTTSTLPTTTSSSTTTTTTTLSFDTVLTFSSSTTDSEEGVTGLALATNPILKFEFNKVINPVGLYNVMNISVLGSPVLQITYRTEYLGQTFRFTHTSGTVYISTFGSDKNF